MKLLRNYITTVLFLGFVLLMNHSVQAHAADDIDIQIQEATQALHSLTYQKSRQELETINERLVYIENALSTQSNYDAQNAIESLSAQISDLRASLSEITVQISALAQQQQELSRIKENANIYAEQSPSADAAAVTPPAPKEVNYTQDAASSYGNSTAVFRYSPNQLYKVYCRTGFLTDIALKKGETVSFVGGGDTAGWAVNSTTVDGTAHIYIKPVIEGTPATNLIITTEKRSYQIMLECADWYNPMIKWTYDLEDQEMNMLEKEKEERVTTANLNISTVEDLDFDYEVSGKGEKPFMVFSDGEKTYLKFKKQQKKQVPIFIRPRGKKELSLVNYRIKDNYYIIEAVFDFAQIKYDGKDVIEIKHK